MRSADKFRCLSRLLRRSSTILVFATVSACAMLPEQASQPLPESLRVSVERGAGVPDGRIVFKPIPGGLLGKAQDVELFESSAERFDVPVARLASAIDPYAAITHSDTTNPGELVEPRDLRIARIATLFEPIDVAAGCNNYRTGLRTWPVRATLVYVDRAGSVRGTRYARPYLMEYDLEFPAAGLYAINSRVEGIRLVQTVATPVALVARVQSAPCTETAEARQAAR